MNDGDVDEVDSAAGATSVSTAAERHATEPLPLLELVSRSGGRLYTLDQQEAARAPDFGLTAVHPPVGYFPRGAAAGTKPLYRLKPGPGATSWLATASTQERDSLVGRGWVLEGVTGHVYRDPGRGRVRLVRFSRNGEWRLALETRTTALQQAGYRVDGTVGYVYQTWIRAGAVYFGMFNAAGHQRIIRRTEEIYGRPNDWWGGVRDFHDGTSYASGPWPGEDFSWLRPSIGYYDDSKPETLERHITQATSAGLSFFNFYWYWDGVSQKETTTVAALDSFLAARNREGIDFTVGLCAHPWGNLRIPTTQYDAVAQVLVDKYLVQDNTLRTNDGRRIFTLCDPRGLGDGSPAQIALFVDTVRRRARARFGEEIFVMITHGGFDPRQVPQAGGDAAYCTIDGPAVESRSYGTYLSRQPSFFAEAPGAYARCLTSDFDERPRYPIEQPDAAAIRWFPDQSIEGFRQAARTVRDDIASSTRPPTVDNLVFVYAWNEWHEGGVVEPNERDGCAYLDALTAEFSLLRAPGCVAAPPPLG